MLVVLVILTEFKHMVKVKDKKPTELAIYDDNTGDVLAVYPSEMVETLQNTVAKNSTKSELIMFLSIANKYGLDPFLKEIWFIKYKNDPMIMTSRDGFVKIVKQNPHFVKIVSDVVCENDDFQMQWEGMDIKTFTHTHSANERGEVIGAWAGIRMTNWNTDLIVYVDRKEYDKKTQIWKTYTSSMIRKVAEKEVCRLAGNISGLHTPEEMGEEYSLDYSKDKIVEQKQTTQKDVVDVDVLKKE